MSDRWIPLGAESIEDEGGREYSGYKVRFVPAKFGRCIAKLYDEDGQWADSIYGADFDDAYESARDAWPGAVWRNREEEL